MPLELLSGSVATQDNAFSLDTLARGVPIGEVTDLVLQVSGATVAIGDGILQPVTLAASATLVFDRANMTKLYVRSNAAGVPGTVSFVAWKAV